MSSRTWLSMSRLAHSHDSALDRLYRRTLLRKSFTILNIFQSVQRCKPRWSVRWRDTAVSVGLGSGTNFHFVS